MHKFKMFLVSFIDSITLLAPVVACIIVLLTNGNRTLDGKQISLLTMPEWGFVATFLYITVLRDKMRTVSNNALPENHVRVTFLGSLALISAIGSGKLYEVSAGLVAAPPYIQFLGQFQMILLCAAIIFHWYFRYEEYVKIPAP